MSITIPKENLPFKEEELNFIIEVLKDEIENKTDSISFTRKDVCLEYFEEYLKDGADPDEYNLLVPISSNIRRYINSKKMCDEENQLLVSFLECMDEFFGYNTEEGTGIIGIKLHDYFKTLPKIDPNEYPNIYKLYTKYKEQH